MAKTYDATLNDLIGARPGDWAAHFAALAGIPPGPKEALDTDLATTVQADRVFRIAGAVPALLHLELEAHPRLGIPRDLLRYNTLLDLQYGAPVETVLVLLRPKAHASDHTGVYTRAGAAGAPITTFRYHIERVWQRSVDYWLSAGPGLAPLALLTDDAVADLEPAVARFRRCVYDQTADDKLRYSLVSSSFMLCGLRHNATRMAEVFAKMSLSLEDSTTYQWTIQKGIVQGLRATVLRLGTKRFGTPAPEVASAVEAITDTGRLGRLTEQVLDATGWDELLQTQ